MKTILTLIAVASLWNAASGQMPLLQERHTNQMMMDIAASDVVAIVMINSVGDQDSTNATGQKTRLFTFDGKPERALKGTLPAEVRITFETTNLFSQIYVPDLPASYVCFLKQDGKGYTHVAPGAGLLPLKQGGQGGRFHWRSKYPSVEELESIVKKSLAQK